MRVLRRWKTTSELSEQRIADLLDRVVPTRVEQPEWKRIVTDATAPVQSLPRWRQRRMLGVAIAAVVVLIVAPLSALAVTQGWWFFRFGRAPQPISGIAVVTRGTWNHVRWTLTAYRSATDGICFALTPRSASNPGGSGAAIACDTITGVPVTPASKRSTPHGITYLMGTGPNGGHLPDYITGPVIDTAQTVEIMLANHRRLRVATIPAPDTLQSHIRFYVTQLPRNARVQAIAGLDRHGSLVARLAIPNLSSAAFRMRNQGRLLRFSAAFKHALQRAHRSTDILLLVSRDGTNFYRFGGRNVYGGIGHTCFGVGKTVNLASLQPTQRGVAKLAGIIECSPATATTFPSPQQPVWDLSIYGQNRGQPNITLFRLAGIASDAVKTVNLLDRNRRVVARVPVIDNVYTLKHVPKGVTLVVPTGANGQALAECGPNAKARVRSSGTYLRARC